jgi:Uma2 family endonuclease
MSVEVSTATAANVANVANAADLLRLPRGTWRYELVRGELRRMSPAGHAHGRVAARLTASLGSFVDSHDLGAVYAAETGFLLARSPDTVRAPDVAFVRADRLAAAPAEGFFPGPPDLAVEVVSPSDSYSAVEEKVFEWLDSGCRIVVVLDPRRQVATLYRSRQTISLLSPPNLLSAEEVVPGWSVPLAQLFR